MVRGLLGDTDITGGDVFTNADLLPQFQSSWRELNAMRVQEQIPVAKRVFYHNLLANATMLAPIQAGIKDFGQPSLLEERQVGTILAVSNVASGTGGAIQVTTSTPHGITAPTEVYLSDVLGLEVVNGRWFASVIDSTNVLMLGSIFPPLNTAANSGYVASSGSLTLSSGQRFTEVILRDDLFDRDQDAVLAECSWQGETYQFIGATQIVQLKITFFTSGDPPTTGSLIYDDIMEPLAYRTASLAAYKHSRGEDESGRLDIEARGQNRDGSGGAYYRWLQPRVRQLQQVPLRRPIEPPAHLVDVYDPLSIV